MFLSTAKLRVYRLNGQCIFVSTLSLSKRVIIIVTSDVGKMYNVLEYHALPLLVPCTHTHTHTLAIVHFEYNLRVVLSHLDTLSNFRKHVHF